MRDLTPLATLTQEDLAAVWSLCPAGCIWVWSLPGMARLEEGAECEGGRPIASFLLSLGSALGYSLNLLCPLPALFGYVRSYMQHMGFSLDVACTEQG